MQEIHEVLVPRAIYDVELARQGMTHDRLVREIVEDIRRLHGDVEVRVRFDE